LDLPDGVFHIKLKINCITNSVAYEPEGSSPHSQQLATGPYPEPVESNPNSPDNLPKLKINGKPGTYAYINRFFENVNCSDKFPLNKECVY
jgi:hypothetical protein